MSRKKIESVVGLTRRMDCVASATFKLEDGITVEVVSYPEGVQSYAGVLRGLIEWLEINEYKEILDKIEELEGWMEVSK